MMTKTESQISGVGSDRSTNRATPLPKEPLELFAWYKLLAQTISTPWAVVVAWLVERSLPTPEVRGSNPVIGEILFIYSLSTVLKGRKQRKKMPGMAQWLVPDFGIFSYGKKVSWFVSQVGILRRRALLHHLPRPLHLLNLVTTDHFALPDQIDHYFVF